MDKFIIMNVHDATPILYFKHGSLKILSLFCCRFMFKHLEMNLKVSLKNKIIE
jgi:hypothetical protein